MSSRTRPTVDALLGLTSRWTTESDGRAEAIAVVEARPERSAPSACVERRAVEIDAADAMAHMAWAAASGGAHGRRRGWRAAASTHGGRSSHSPARSTTGRSPPDEVGDAAQSLRWFVWDAYEPKTGWWLRLAVEDPDEGLAWAIAATDQSL